MPGMTGEPHDPTGKLDRLRTMLATEMPIAQPLGIRVVGFEDGRLSLQAPLAQNQNHQGTAFAGSVNGLATLAGWGRVWLALLAADVDAELVIQDSSIRYLHPVTADFTASCAPPEQSALERLTTAVRKHGRGRITMAVSVRVHEHVVAEFEGRYVALASATRGREDGAPSR